MEASRVLSVNGISSCPAEHLKQIAASEGIKVLFRSVDDEPGFGGQLIYSGKKAGILVNICIPNIGKHNFTLSHELGHYFLKHTPTYEMDGLRGFRCTAKDMESDRNTQEYEANRFAAALLMPEDQFYMCAVGSILDYTLIGNLARQFRVSKHACCNRLLEFTKKPYIVIWSQDYSITEIRTSPATYRKLLPFKSIPKGTAAYEAITQRKNQNGFVECDPAKWPIHLNLSIPLYEWTRGSWKNGVAMTILKL
jgi:Zn-dependent peptidase ImmA (M78 family)